MKRLILLVADPVSDIDGLLPKSPLPKDCLTFIP